MSYAHTNGLDMYFEEHGSGDGTPLLLLHGGIGGGEIFAAVAPELATGRRVIVPDLQGHGRTADIDRPLRAEDLADDVAGLIESLGLERADVMGYSLGGEVAWRVAIQHPGRVRRLVVISASCRRSGSFPEVLAAMDQMSAEMAPMMEQSAACRHYAQVAPRPQDWADHVGRTAEMLKIDFDWTDEVAADRGAHDARLRRLGLRHARARRRALPPARRRPARRGLGRLGAAPRPARRAARARTHYDVIEAPGLRPGRAPVPRREG